MIKGDLYRWKHSGGFFIILGIKEDLPSVYEEEGEPLRFLCFGLEEIVEEWDYSSFVYENAEKIG
jgi:hypothetical protein